MAWIGEAEKIARSGAALGARTLPPARRVRVELRRRGRRRDRPAPRHPARSRIFTLDTGACEETYEVAERIRKRYGITIEGFFPAQQAIEELERTKGLFSFRDSIEARKECCGNRKLEPLRRALTGLDLWITGLRREQNVTRAAVAKLEADEVFGLLKLNPLAEWTEQQVWEHIRAHDLPYNALHDRGFPSIGCAPCTRAVAPGEDARAGRWWWELPESKECGLHASHPGARTR
jgi:phosphoadenosine phosphosulfate reductase